MKIVSEAKELDVKMAFLNVVAAGALSLLAVTVTAAPAPAQDMRPGRYTMHKADDGFVRLDTETGQIALCRKTAAGWGCESMPGGGTDRSPGAGGASSQNLMAENSELKAEIKRLEELLGLRGERHLDRNGSAPFKLPTEKDVDQALDYFERMLKKFQERLKRLEQSAPKSEQRQL